MYVDWIIAWGVSCIKRTGVSARPRDRSLYWVAERPLMGSSLTSGGSLRRNTSCFVCHTCTTMRSWQSIHCHDNTSIWSNLWRHRVLTHWLGNCAVVCSANHVRQRFHCCQIQCACGPLYEFSSQRDSSVYSWRKRRLYSAWYGRPVACLVHTRSSIKGQLGWIFSQICRACSRLRSLRMKMSVASWFAAACEVICRGHMCRLALTVCSHWSASMGPGSKRLTMILLLLWSPL